MQPFYLVAGGPSLRGFDWSFLIGKRCIAINRSFERLPDAVLYFTDRRFWDWHREAIVAHPGRKITGASVKHVCHPTVENWILTGARGLDTTYGQIRHGNNGGYAAINVAYHLGARRMYLLGYDFRYDDERSHWHEGHPTLHRERVFDKMLPHFPFLASELAERGVEVYNVNPDSALRAFPFCTLEDALADQPNSASIAWM